MGPCAQELWSESRIRLRRPPDGGLAGPLTRSRLRSSALVGALVVAALAGCATTQPPPVPAPSPQPPAPLIRLDAAQFTELEAWPQSDPRGALQAFVRSCTVLATKADDAQLGGVNYAGTAGEWRHVCDAAALVSTDDPETVRGFFESEFAPYRVGQAAGAGLFTGYYEPQLRGSRTRHGAYQTPLYGVPLDLVNVDLGLFRETLKGQRIVGRSRTGGWSRIRRARRSRATDSALPPRFSMSMIRSTRSSCRFRARVESSSMTAPSSARPTRPRTAGRTLPSARS